METGSILIKGERKHFQNIRQGASNVLEHKRSRFERYKEFIEVYIDNQNVFVIVYKKYISDGFGKFFVC